MNSISSCSPTRCVIAWIATRSGELVSRAFLATSLAASFVIWPLAGTAQTPIVATGSIAGIVRDSAGLRLDQVAIGVVGGGEQRAASNDSGTYHIAAIGVGAMKLFARRLAT